MRAMSSRRASREHELSAVREGLERSEEAHLTRGSRALAADGPVPHEVSFPEGPVEYGEVLDIRARPEHHPGARGCGAHHKKLDVSCIRAGRGPEA